MCEGKRACLSSPLFTGKFFSFFWEVWESIFLGMWLRYFYFMEPNTSDFQIYFQTGISPVQCDSLGSVNQPPPHPLRAYAIRNPNGDSQGVRPTQVTSSVALCLTIQTCGTAGDFVPREPTESILLQVDISPVDPYAYLLA